MAAAEASIDELYPEANRILWDVMEEYIDEAEFAAETFESALDDPEYNLEELAAGPEAKLIACVDGLVIGGSPVVDRLLRGEIDSADSADPARCISVVLAMLACERQDLVTPCLSHDSAYVRDAAARACALSTNPELDAWLIDRLAAATIAAERAAVLDAIAARGLRLESLTDSLSSDDPAELAAGARAAKHAGPGAHLGAIQWLVVQGEPAVRDPALITALHYGSRECWSVCERLALDSAEPNPMAMEVYAALGGPQQHDRLAETLALDSHRAPALRALGFSGNPGLVDQLLPYLQEGGDELEAKLATEAVSLIAGLDLRDDAFVVEGEKRGAEQAESAAQEELPPLDDDLEADLALKPEDALPTPNAEAIQRWWAEERAKLDPKRRHLAGKPWSGAAIADYLEHGALRSRHMVALSLSIRTGGKAYVDTRAFTAGQRAQARHIPLLGSQSFVRKYSQW